jgi:hypothetical protein
MTKKKELLTKEETIQLYKFYFPPQTKSTNETLKKVYDNEEIFILRALDETTPVIILDWIRENFYTAPEDKLRSAFEAAFRA